MNSLIHTAKTRYLVILNREFIVIGDLLAHQYQSFAIDYNALVPVYIQYFCVAVRCTTVVDEACKISFHGCIDHLKGCIKTIIHTMLKFKTYRIIVDSEHIRATHAPKLICLFSGI
jgi:hypothetical protein